VLGFHLCYLNNIRNFKNYYNYDHAITSIAVAQINSIPIKGEKTTKTEMSMLLANYSGKTCKVQGNFLAYFENSKNLKINYGDLILFNSKMQLMEDPKNPGAFNFKEYLEKKNIFHSVYIKENKFKVLGNKKISFLKDLAIGIKLKLLSILKENKLVNQELAIASSLLLGYDEEIDNELSNAYALTGTIHVLSVSGLHIGIIFLVLNKMFSFLGKTKKGLIIQGILVLSGVWLFAMISGLSPSVVRAAVMFSLFIFGKTFKLPGNIFNTLLASAFLVLLSNPFLILDIGFQLSYLAIGGILFFQPKIYAWFKFKNKLIDKTWSLTSVSLAAQITTFPLTIYYFNNFSISFIVANLLIIPLSTIIMYGGMLLLATSYISAISNFIGLLMKYTIQFMNNSTVFISEIPGSHIGGIFINAKEMILIYCMLIGFTAYLIHQEKKNIFFVMITFIALLASINYRNFVSSTQQEMVVYNQKENSCVDIFFGNNVVRVGKPSLDAKKNLLIHNSNNITQLKLIEDLVYQINDFSFVSISDLKKVEAGTSPTIILLNNNKKIWLPNLSKKFPHSLIVADGTNRISKNIKWKNTADSLNLRFWNTIENGAFRLKIK
jgi:competence protein ComEC